MMDRAEHKQVFALFHFQLVIWTFWVVIEQFIFVSTHTNTHTHTERRFIHFSGPVPLLLFLIFWEGEEIYVVDYLFFSKIVDVSVFLANGVRLCQNEWISIKSGLIKSPPP